MIGYFLQVQLFQRNNAFVMHRCNMLLRKKITTIKKAPQVFGKKHLKSYLVKQNNVQALVMTVYQIHYFAYQSFKRTSIFGSAALTSALNSFISCPR